MHVAHLMHAHQPHSLLFRPVYEAISTCVCTSNVSVNYLQPFVKSVLHLEQSLLPCLDPCFKRLDEGGAPHRLCLNDLVIQVCLDIINGCQNGHTSVPIGDGIEDDGVPLILHSLHGFLQTELFASSRADRLQVVQEWVQFILEHLAEGGARVGCDGETYNIRHFVPVALPQARVAKDVDCGEVVLEGGREGGREKGREGGREKGLEGGREKGREGGREKGREGGREGSREEGRGEGREGGRGKGRRINEEIYTCT